jgi:hypothetical protein
MSFRGLQQPREMWLALHDQGRADSDLWEIALCHVRCRGCAACDSVASSRGARPVANAGAATGGAVDDASL